MFLIKLNIVPALADNWRYIDQLGYQFRTTNGKGYQSRNMLVKKHDFPGGWTYQLEIRKPGDTMYTPFQLTKKHILPGPNLAIKELPEKMYEALRWDDYTPELLKEEIRAGITHIRAKYISKSVRGGIKNLEASREIWVACMGEGNQAAGQPKDYWANFDPRQKVWAEFRAIRMPVSDPDFGAFAYRCKMKNLDYELKKGNITRQEYDEKVNQLMHETARREDAEKIVEMIEQEENRTPENSPNNSVENPLAVSNLYSSYMQTMDGHPVNADTVAQQIFARDAASASSSGPVAAPSSSSTSAQDDLNGARMRPANPWNLTPGKHNHSTPRK